MNTLNSSASPEALRALLRERFPEAHARAKEHDGSAFETGCRDLDEIGLGVGTTTEVVQARANAGGALLIARLLGGAQRLGRPVALVDGRDSFDPCELSPQTLALLLWLRARSVNESVRAADLLLRDGNLPLVLIDLALNPPGEIARVPDTSWQRLRSLAKKTSTVLLVITPQQAIPRPHLRISLHQSYTLAAFCHPRDEVALGVETTRGSRVSSPRKIA